tara:strand:+ start:309970 stop:310392 length:423 start_codon:yes stop_codon:yes gene_type:complete
MKQEIAVTVDAVVLNNQNNKPKVLLIKRKNDPFENKWAIPGGFLEKDENLEYGAKRELEEETGLKINTLIQLKTYGEVDRDPRGRTISIAFIAITQQQEVKAADDALEAKWFDLKELPSLAFDHSEILEDAKLWLISQKP